MKLMLFASVFPLFAYYGSPSRQMSNKEILKRFYEEVYVQWNMETSDELLSPDFISHDWPKGYQGAEGFRKYYKAFKNSLPDARYKVKDILADGDRVAVRWEMTATYTQAFPGIDIPPSGQRVTLKGVAIYRIEDGRLAERWVVSDLYELIKNMEPNKS